MDLDAFKLYLYARTHAPSRRARTLAFSCLFFPSSLFLPPAPLASRRGRARDRIMHELGWGRTGNAWVFSRSMTGRHGSFSGVEGEKKSLEARFISFLLFSLVRSCHLHDNDHQSAREAAVREISYGRIEEEGEEKTEERRNSVLSHVASLVRARHSAFGWIAFSFAFWCNDSKIPRSASREKFNAILISLFF